MKKLIIPFIFFLSFIFTQKTLAEVRFDNPEFNVEITIDKDSSYIVREEIVYKAYGEFHGLRRDITLENPGLREFCLRNPGSTCGGFDRLIPIAVYDIDGTQLNQNQYRFYEIENNDTNIRYARFEREYYPNGRRVNGETFGWIVEYKILGGIQWIRNHPYFYWNVLAENRSGNTKESNIKILFPEDVIVQDNNLILYDTYRNQSVDFLNNSIEITLRDIGSTGNFTVAYQFNEEDILKPATLQYTITSPLFSNSVFLDNVEISNERSATLNFIPSGERTIRFSNSGYKDQVFNITFEPGEVESIEVALEPVDWMKVLLLLNTLGFFVGLCLIPLAIAFVGFYYYKKGRDQNMPKTIIPLFSPPEGVKPYLLGTLKDETVDKIDITGTIIDLAYRGYIKIKELEKGKKYELIKLDGKKGDTGLNDIEQYIYDSIFNSKDSVTTEELRVTFPPKYYMMVHKIYKEVVSRGYFKKSPLNTRAKYAGIGIFLLIDGLIAACVLSIVGTGFIGYIVICSPAIALFVLGLGFLIVSKFMPAKTSLGSKVYAEILGFRMYLYTAERYRLQNLTPDEFERYLSYAVVFGIEKEWAKKFEGIYNKTPDWYEGSSTTVWDAVIISSLIRSFANSTTTSMTPIPSSCSSTGGGWSGGGGSFGGFSGGGGGGGSSGGW